MAGIMLGCSHIMSSDPHNNPWETLYSFLLNKENEDETLRELSQGHRLISAAEHSRTGQFWGRICEQQEAPQKGL